MCVCVCMHVCMHECVHAYVCVAFVCLLWWVCVCVCVCAHVCMHVCVFVAFVCLSAACECFLLVVVWGGGGINDAGKLGEGWCTV